MDPSIMKLLEEDEDESMHSGADVEAFQTALNRDIGGDSSTSQLPDPAALSQESSQTSNQSFPNWPVIGQDNNANALTQPDLKGVQHQKHDEKQPMDLTPHGSTSQNLLQQNDMSQEPNCLQQPQMQQSQDDLCHVKVEQVQHQHPQTSGMQVSRPAPVSDADKMSSADSESQFLKAQKMASQQTPSLKQPSSGGGTNTKNHNKQIPFMLLLPALKPHLDKDREMQLQTLFGKLRKNEIAKDQFVRLMRNIVGDQVLKLAVSKLESQRGSQSQIQSQGLPRQHHVKMPGSTGAAMFSDPSRHPSSSVPMQTDLSYSSAESNAQKYREVDRPPDSHGVPISQMPSFGTGIINQERERSSLSMQGHNKQQPQLQQQQQLLQKQQQHLHFPQTSFPMYGSSGSNYHAYTAGKGTTSSPSLKPQTHDLQSRQTSHQNTGATQLGGPTQPMNMMSVPKFERQNSVNDPNRVQSGPLSHYANKSALQQPSVPWQAPTSKDQNSTTFSSINYTKQEQVEQPTEQQHRPQLSNPQALSSSPLEQGLKDESFDRQSSKVVFSTTVGMGTPNSIPSTNASQLDPNIQVGSRTGSVASAAGINARIPPKKPSSGQKKPLESLGSPPLASSNKKQKVSGPLSDESIEQLNDVAAVSGVNLREEEEQLFSGLKEDRRASEASRRVVQEEEEKLILQKAPLQKKLTEIMGKCGLKNISNDVERCLSLCVEERMRGLISNLIRLSKQRVDVEKSRHRTLLSSDVRDQIMTMNRKAKEEWEKRQAEAEKLRKVNEPEGDDGADGDKEKDVGRLKSGKAKEEDDKMRTTAANVAARAAVGGDDMFSKWQLMAEQARQNAASGSQPSKGANSKALSSDGNMKDNHDAEKNSPATSAAGGVRKFGRNQVVVPQTRVVRSISVKDVIAVLEREPQMSRSTLLYKLQARTQPDSAAE